MNTESFPTPEGPEDIILECDGCRNLLYIKASNQVGEVADCPICGCLNKVILEQPEQIRGRLLLKSPEMSMNRDSVEQGRVALPGLPEKVQEALIWLQENKWTFGFIVEEDDKDSKDESS